jgi:arsenite methyltransferase
MNSAIHFESAVRNRYSAASQTKVEALCCPVEYNREYLKVIPQEVIERDYGCGDPSRYVKPGETVLDLGSGTGKICFIAAQVVGAKGRVIGVDMNDDMLALARKYAPVVGETIGYHNVEFRKGRIQDLALDLEKLDADLKQNPIGDANSFLAAEARAAELRVTAPLIASDSIDVVVSNCVLNLVEPRAKAQLFEEIFRVLKPGGRAVISDIVSDSAVPLELQNDPELWSGCISGALAQEAFIEAFVRARFYGVRILKRDAQPWRTVAGIEFRSLTLEAFKEPAGEAREHGRAIIYKGPFREVVDDHGRRMERGKHYNVTDQAFRLYTRAPYENAFEAVDPGRANGNCGKESNCC